MTSSDQTRLPEGALDGLSRRPGRCVGARRPRAAGACGSGSPARCSTAASPGRLLDGALDGLGRVRGRPGRHHRGLGARAPSSCRCSPSAFAAPGPSTRWSCLGAVIRGDTGHFDFVAGECASGSSGSSSTPGVPVVFGVLTTDTVDQALERSAPGDDNKGREAALTAVEMARLLRRRAPSAGAGRGGPGLCDDLRMLRLVLPKGSLEAGHLRAVRRRRPRGHAAPRTSTTGPPSTTPGSTEVRILRPQEIPVYVADGLFDLGITGRDWIEERGSEVVSLGELALLQGHLATRSGSCWPWPRTRRSSRSRTWPAHPRPLRVSTEYPELTRRAAGRARRRGRDRRSPTAPPRPRCPTSPTAWSRSPRPAGPCGPPACGSSTPCSSRTPS